MTLTEILKLTKLEMEVLEHRLTVPDCLCTVLNDDGKDLRWQEDDIHDIAELLVKDELKKAMDMSERLTIELLKEAVEGSTYYACAMSAYDGGEITVQKLNAIQRACESVAKKVSKYLFLDKEDELVFPLY